MTQMNEWLLEVLACPKCKGAITLTAEGDSQYLVCQSCLLRYPIKDGIPIMLVDQAERF